MEWKLGMLFLATAVVSAAFGLAVAFLWKRDRGTYRASGKATAEGVEFSVEISDGVAHVSAVAAGDTTAKAAQRALVASVPLEVQS